MDFHLDITKLYGPAPGSFEANILRSIAVPFQEMVTSGGQYPLPEHPVFPSIPGPPIVIQLEGLSYLSSFKTGVTPLAIKDEKSE